MMLVQYIADLSGGPIGLTIADQNVLWNVLLARIVRKKF
jgi:hypothetical protein